MKRIATVSAIVVAIVLSCIWVGYANPPITSTIQKFVILTLAQAAGLPIDSTVRKVCLADPTTGLCASGAPVSNPVTVLQGGTGATTASGARTNLGVAPSGQDGSGNTFTSTAFGAGLNLSTLLSGGATISAAGVVALANSGSSIFTHTLTTTTPTAVVNSSTVPFIDVENQLLAASVTSMTLPAAAAVADGQIIHWFVQQSASGGPFTLAAGTVGPLTAGSGTIVVAATGVVCPTIGSTQSSTVPSELHMDLVYRASLTEWVLETCAGVR